MEIVQVVIGEPLLTPFKQWLAARQLELVLFSPESDADLATYIVGIAAERMKSVEIS